MSVKKKILIINGNASSRLSNELLISYFVDQTKECFQLRVLNGLKTLPNFDPELSVENTPAVISDFRNSFEKADGVLIFTPEYVFSIPSGLKNAIEW